MVAFRQRKITGQISDGSEYKAVLERDALYLIIEGHELLAGESFDYSDANEEHITGDLTEATIRFINSLVSPDWTKHYCVQEERRENTKGKTGKHRKRVDIACILTGRKPQEVMKFEAKRLRVPEYPVSKYIGEKGLGEFISGAYAPEAEIVGMLGYVQSDDCKYWEGELADEIQTKKKAIRLRKNSRWEKADFVNIDHCNITKHDRKVGKRDLLVYHLLLDFTEPNN